MFPTAISLSFFYYFFFPEHRGLPRLRSVSILKNTTQQAAANMIRTVYCFCKKKIAAFFLAHACFAFLLRRTFVDKQYHKTKLNFLIYILYALVTFRLYEYTCAA